MTDVIRWADIPEKAVHRGHYRKQVEYPTCYVALHRYTGDGEGYEPHDHPETQAGLVLSGEMAMQFDGAPGAIGKNNSYVIPSGLRHGGKAASDESIVINLYVKRHLVAPANGRAGLFDWSLAREPAVIAGVRQSLLSIPPGQAPPRRSESAEDGADILLSGSIDGLDRWDVMRLLDESSFLAGAHGARIFRMEILRKAEASPTG